MERPGGKKGMGMFKEQKRVDFQNQEQRKEWGEMGAGIEKLTRARWFRRRGKAFG